MAEVFKVPEMPKMPEMPEMPKMPEIENTLNNVKSSINNNLQEYSSQASVYGNTSTEFLNSNGLVAKFGFLLLVVILFLIFVNLGIKFISYLLSPSKNPYLINGIVSGNAAMTIPQDPQNANYIAIPFSNNQQHGVEFTWNFWIYIANLNPSSPSYSHIFNKGNAQWSTDGFATINNAPGVYIGNTTTTNKLCVCMDTVDGSSTNKITIDGIPMGNWVNISIRLQNTLLDVYTNGVFTERKQLTAVPKQNYDDVNIGHNGGFSGNLSNLRYYSHALSVFEMQNIALYGPNLATNSANGTPPYFPYLSYQWYSTQK